jgi:hypothetical protein
MKGISWGKSPLQSGIVCCAKLIINILSFSIKVSNWDGKSIKINNKSSSDPPTMLLHTDVNSANASFPLVKSSVKKRQFLEILIGIKDLTISLFMNSQAFGESPKAVEPMAR